MMIENSTSSTYQELISRNLGVLTADEQGILASCCVAIAGVGGVGGNQAVNLTRAGVGRLLLADPESFASADRNRQHGAFQSTLDENKARVMERFLLDINPACGVEVFDGGVTLQSAGAFVEDADFVVDAIEYHAPVAKLALYRAAREAGKPVFTCPIVGFGCRLMVFDPEGMTFEEFFDLQEGGAIGAQRLRSFLPAYIDETVMDDAAAGRRAFPSLSGAAALSGAVLATEILIAAIGRRRPACIPRYTLIDLLSQSLTVVDDSWAAFWTSFAHSGYEVIGQSSENRQLLSRAGELAGQGGHVLDAGCGSGNLVLLLAENNRVTGVDFSAGMVALASKKTGHLENVDIHRGDVTQLRFPQNTFDAVTSVNVLVNLDPGSCRAALSEANRVLKPGGTLVVTCLLQGKAPSEEDLQGIRAEAVRMGVSDDQIQALFQHLKTLKDDGGFRYTPTLSEIEGLVEGYGFEVTISEPIYFGSSVIISAKKVKEI